MLYSTLHPPFQGLGSLAKAAVASMLRSSPDLRVVQRWIHRVCEGLNSNSPGQLVHFRQLFMVACTLAFDIGREDAREFLPRAPMFEHGDFVIQNFVRFLAAEGSDSLALGSSYLKCVLQ